MSVLPAAAGLAAAEPASAAPEAGAPAASVPCEPHPKTGLLSSSKPVRAEAGPNDVPCFQHRGGGTALASSPGQITGTAVCNRGYVLARDQN